MMKFFQLVVLTACVWSCLGLVPESNYESEAEWEAWKAQYDKNYSSEKEEVMRRWVWEKNLMMITKHNLEQQQGLHSYRLGMNAFGDMEHDEIAATFNGYRKGEKSRDGSTFIPPENVKLPESLDWRAEGYVTPVKNQLHCGSCWAFSAIGSLEGQHFKSTGKLVSLSEQNLVDCSVYEGNRGCNGGRMVLAFQYVIDSGGIESEDSYPYVGKEEDCKFDKGLIAATCKNYSTIFSGIESDLQKAVAGVGPISVAIDASQSSFQFYKSGVYDDPQCSSWFHNHGVLVVGYNTTETGQDYWIVKNSWSKDWGDEGYMWMSRNKDNQCGIASHASYPLM